MKRVFGSLLLVCLLAAGTIQRGSAGATEAWAASLPQGARIISQVALPYRTNAFAALYDDPTARVGVLRGKVNHRRLLWSRPLPSGRATVVAPGPHGVFLVLVKVDSSPVVHLFAYGLREGTIVSVVAGRRSGELTAGEGVHRRGEDFATRNQDSQHVGSVAYRIITHYTWQSGLFRETSEVRVPDYRKADYPVPNATVRTAQGNLVLLRLEIADIEPERQTGLMFRNSLDADSGMIFVWPQDSHDPFWMENTYIPLSIAFLSAAGQIQEIQDMAPLSTVLHTPASPYRYAIEMNQGFFARWGISTGDTLQLHLDIRAPVPLA